MHSVTAEDVEGCINMHESTGDRDQQRARTIDVYQPVEEHLYCLEMAAVGGVGFVAVCGMVNLSRITTPAIMTNFNLLS